MVKTDINDVNDKKGATVTEPQVSNSPKVNEDLRKQIIMEEEIKAKALEEIAKKQAEAKVEPKVTMSPPQHTNQDPIVNVTNDGLTADDMSRINQDMNSLKREMKQEAMDNVETTKKLETEMRAKILRELQEEQAKKDIVSQVTDSNKTIIQLQEQIKVLNERIPKHNIGQEVDGNSPFENEKSLETASESDIKRIDEASRIAFQNERMRL